MNLKPNHVRVWEYLHSSIKVNKYAPLIRDVAKELRLTTRTVSIIYKELEKMGAVKREARKKAGIKTLIHPQKIK